MGKSNPNLQHCRQKIHLLSMLGQGMCKKAWIIVSSPASGSGPAMKINTAHGGIVIFRSHYKLSLNMLQLLKLETALSM